MPLEANPRRVILHVDDNENDRLLIRAAADVVGAQVDVCSLDSIEAAREFILKEACPAGSDPLNRILVLLDFHLGLRTGVELLSWIRRQPNGSQLPIIILSDSDCPLVIGQCYAQGANCYLAKAKGFDRLQVIMRALCDCAVITPPHFAVLEKLPEYRSPDGVQSPQHRL